MAILALASTTVFGLSLSPTSSLLSYSPYDRSIKAATGTYWTNGPDWTWGKAQLFQESGLQACVSSPVGAQGIAQFMPGTWAQITRELGWKNVSPCSTYHAVIAYAYYMRKLQISWSYRPRSNTEKHRLAQASYNAGLGSIISAQGLCNDAPLWEDIFPCLNKVTGPENAQQTIDYVDKIAGWQEQIR